MLDSDNPIINLNLKELKKYQTLIPELADFPSRVLIASYEEFLYQLYKDIDRIVSLKEENPEYCQDDSEDKITIDIKNSLCLLGYNATHDTKVGGHADLVVNKKEYKWIGEAKIHSSYEYLWEGFLHYSMNHKADDRPTKWLAINFPDPLHRTKLIFILIKSPLLLEKFIQL